TAAGVVNNAANTTQTAAAIDRHAVPRAGTVASTIRAGPESDITRLLGTQAGDGCDPALFAALGIAIAGSIPRLTEHRAMPPWGWHHPQ
ncbi:MAG TPA: hypothetical protein VNC79_09360, partial [Mycobacteriales bacterium]|nr:hypothetical protein [Mycobacteriales bacterium]